MSETARALGWTLLLAWASPAAGTPVVTFAHALSDFGGVVPLGEARVVPDPEHGEVYVALGRSLHVFNRFGMEIHSVEMGSELGPIRDVAVRADGSIVVLSRRDYRGLNLGEIAVSGVPESHAAFRPNRLFSRGESLVLLSTSQMLALAVGPDGAVGRALDLAPVLGVPDADRAAYELSGAGMDPRGNLLLSIAVLFRVFVVSPEGSLVASWGKAGSAVGAFGNAAGIDADDAGRVFVVDRIRKVVLVFDESRRLLLEFGGDPHAQGRLVMPSDVVLDGGLAYVTQVGRAGVWVFRVE